MRSRPWPERVVLSGLLVFLFEGACAQGRGNSHIGSNSGESAGSLEAGVFADSAEGASGAEASGAFADSAEGASGGEASGALADSAQGVGGRGEGGVSGSAQGGGESDAYADSAQGGGNDTTFGSGGGPCTVPAAGALVDVRVPTTVVGDGSATSCTADKVVAAVAAGGVVTFSCGAAPITIVVPEIEIINDGGVSKDGSVTIDGGGKITLSGGGKNRILRQNACDPSLHFTTSHCNDQDSPHLVLQNIALTDGAGVADQVDSQGLLGGGAVYVGGGTFKAVNVTITNSRQINAAGQLVQDLAGGAIYTVDMSHTSPVYVVNSKFTNNSGINGGALGSIGTSWTIVNSVFVANAATGHGENPARSGTEGGGLGGAIYNDGNSYTLTLCGSQLRNNLANELGSGAIFQVVDNLSGALAIDQSAFTGNSDTGDVQPSANHPGVYVQARSTVDGTSGVMITGSSFH